jgi:hypothetical protein
MISRPNSHPDAEPVTVRSAANERGAGGCYNWAEAGALGEYPAADSPTRLAH